MRKVILLILVASSCWGAACTAAANGNWNAKTTWGASGCSGASALCADGTSPCPGVGDTVGIGYAVTQNVPNLIIGVNGANPVTSYLKTLTGGGGTGYTSCSASLSGGTLVGYYPGSVSCDIVGGAVTPFIADRGSYSVCPTITITATGGSGATLPGTLTCATAGGTAAIDVGGTDSGVLTIAADTYVRGTVSLGGNYSVYGTALTINPGANLFMDMTQAPTGALYRIEFPTYFRGITADCSSQHISGINNNGCSIQGFGGVSSIDTALNSATYYPSITLKNVYFKNFGDANTAALVAGNTGGSYPATVEDSTFDTSGVAMLLNNDGSGTTIWSGNTHKNSPTRYIGEPITPNLSVSISNSLTTGIRQITNNAFDGAIATVPFNSVSLQGFTITGNVFNKGLYAQRTGATLWSSFQDNFWRSAPITTDGELGLGMAGDMNNVYVFLDSSITINPHHFVPPPVTTTVSGMIGGFSGRNTGDSGEWFLASVEYNNLTTVQNSLFLCDSTGMGSSEIISTLGTNAYSWVFSHDTYCGGYGYAAVDTNETGLNTAGVITMKSNLIWVSPLGSATTKMFTINDPGTQDMCTTTSATVSNCDYNAGYGTAATQATGCTGCTNQGRGYGGKWSFTPGYHDVDGQNPRFVDATRKVENFDRKYLGKTLSSQWSNGPTYAYGDLVSNSHAQVYAGEAFNFRCIHPSGCTGLGGPGIYDTAWRANWEWASLYWLRELTYQRTKYTDGALGCSGCSVVQALNAWVRAGFVTQNPRYWGAGHDGKDIGAVQLPAVRRMFAGAVVP